MNHYSTATALSREAPAPDLKLAVLSESVLSYLFWTEQKRLPGITSLRTHWWEPPWMGMQLPASVQSHDAHTVDVDILHYSSEHWKDKIQPENMHRDTYPSHTAAWRKPG